MTTFLARKALRLLSLIGLITLFGLLITHRSDLATAAPSAPLKMATISATEARCLFAADCDTFPDNSVATFTLESTTGVGMLHTQLWPRGESGSAGAGLFPYLYRVDLRELVGSGNPGCVTAVSFDFGPVVPLDYDNDTDLEEVFLLTSGSEGNLAPSAIDMDSGQLTISFSPAICGDFSPAQNNGKSSFWFGLASPFRDQAVTAMVTNNVEVDPRELVVQAPQSASGPTLTAVPNSGVAGETIQLIGSGYTPGSYPGTIRWNGTDVDSFTIPNGGAFTQPYTIPVDAPVNSHTVTVCALTPCATGEFEQSALTPVEVTGMAASDFIFLPIAEKPGAAAAEPFSYVVDSTVQPSQSELPGLDGGSPRPLTAVRAPDGTVSTFVANELVLQTGNTAVLNNFLTRVGGTLLMTIDPTEAGLTDLPPIYLVKATLSQADLSGLATDIDALMDTEIPTAGQFEFADGDGPRILALAAEEAASGLTVGINWVSDIETIPIDSQEAPNGVNIGGIPYTQDAYDWAHFAQGTTQDIGVPEAWTLMDRAGRLSNRVDLAILDGGYFPNADFPAGVTYVSVVPFITDPRNVNGVDSSARFHGTDVLQTAVARSDNSSGIVGVAAPIARPIAVYTTYDYVVSIAAVLAARANGAEIINMSYSAQVPSILGWTVWPFEATTAAVRSSGVLLFASAGNDSKDVDGENCVFRICWEHTWHTPCENAGVICVGGLGWNSQLKANGSNFGHEHVDIYAPYTVYSGQSPAAPGGNTTVGLINGTSFSSPYAASVAALIWASDPSLTANEVWTILRDTAHSSPDGRVNRYVNAYDAVLSAIGVGLDAEITAPASGAAYDLGRSVSLAASVGYVATSSGTPVQVEWRVDGALVNTFTYNPGAGSHLLLPSAFASGLSVGSHTVMLRVTAGSVVVEDSVTFTVENTPPTATIDQPGHGDAFCVGELITFRGSAFDPNQFSGLPNSAFAWRSNLNGSFGTGPTVSTSSLGSGTHLITLRVTDNQGDWDEDAINLLVKAASHPDCVDLNPTAVINSPDNNEIFYADSYNGTHWYKEVSFAGEVGDIEDATGDLTVEWISDRQGSLGTAVVNPSTGITTITADMLALDSCGSWHTITLRVTDSAGNITEDQIDIFIGLLC